MGELEWNTPATQHVRICRFTAVAGEGPLLHEEHKIEMRGQNTASAPGSSARTNPAWPPGDLAFYLAMGPEDMMRAAVYMCWVRNGDAPEDAVPEDSQQELRPVSMKWSMDNVRARMCGKAPGGHDAAGVLDVW